MERKILHLDLDAFFCSVEELLRPELKGKAFAVGGSPQGRGVIASCSYAARKFGVRSAMPANRALALCPQLIFVHHQHHLYGEYSDKVMAILGDYSSRVQRVSVDEAFLDVSDLPRPIGMIAQELQQKVWEQCTLPCSIGAATNKLVAKVANDFGKASVKTGSAPRKITVVPPGEEQRFLAPLAVEALWGIGPKTSQKLHQRGIHTIGQLAQMTPAEARLLFGRSADEVQARARGIDQSPVHEDREIKSVSNEQTYWEDTSDPEVMYATLRELSDKVAYRLRKADLAGSVIQLKLRYSDFTTLTRQKALGFSTNVDDEIFQTILALLQENLIPGRQVRLLGVGVSQLSTPQRQLALWDDRSLRKQKLASALDQIKDKYGKDSIQRGSQLKPGAPKNKD
jgi:DNA polymerase-4